MLPIARGQAAARSGHPSRYDADAGDASRETDRLPASPASLIGLFAGPGPAWFPPARVSCAFVASQGPLRFDLPMPDGLPSFVS